MSRILKARETKREIYMYKGQKVDDIIFDNCGNFIIVDGERNDSCCINCVNPQCMKIQEEKIKCSVFATITSNLDMELCPVSAIKIGHASIEIDEKLCNGCGICAHACPIAAISIKNGKAKVNVCSKKGVLQKLMSDEKGMAEQEVFLEKCVKVKKKGIIIQETEMLMENLYKQISALNQEKQNILVRNILIQLGNQSTVSKKGNVYMRLDGFYQNENGYGVLEIETGSDVLDMLRAILDDLAILNSRHGIPIRNNKSLAVCLGLPNKRTDYWQVIKDIKDVLEIKIQTITIGALLILLWNNIEILDFTQFYLDIKNTSFREVIERKIGRQVKLYIGAFGILENEK